jgi:hypothetical protein
LQEQLAQAADLRQQQQLESGLFGQVATGVSAQGPIQTLGGQQAAEALAGQRLAREATEAGLTGEFRGGETAQERALRSQLETGDIQRRLAEAGVTGEYDFGDQRGRADTLQAQALGSEMQGQALERALSRAGATGQFLEEGAPEGARPTETLESRLRKAGMTGIMRDPTTGVGQATLAGRQADMDMIGAILAAQEAEKPGEERMRDLGGALAGALRGFDPRQRTAIQEALGYIPDPNDPLDDDDDDEGATGTDVGAGQWTIDPVTGKGRWVPGGSIGYTPPASVLQGEMTVEEQAQVRGDPLGALQGAAADGSLTPDILKDVPSLSSVLETAEADLAAALNDPSITPEQLEQMRFIVNTTRQAFETYGDS